MMLLAAINWHSFFFLLFALWRACSRSAVLFTSNIVRMAFYLILSLGATAGLFFLAGRRIRRRDAADDLRRRHAGAADLRRDADRPGARSSR